MSEKMTPMPFKKLMVWINDEFDKNGSVFGVSPFIRKYDKHLAIFGEKIETPFGPAAGPNTQLAQNIAASYFAGARFFELKTVQIMDGEELARCIPRPCIAAKDEGYNCEWSTELTVQQAFEEYVKAYFALKIMAKHFGLGSGDGFVFNMSVGYDLAGIKSQKIDAFIEGLKDASNTSIWKECISVLKEMYPHDTDYIENISPNICRSVTLSTLHGCPPDEIERIASYLITEKRLHTFIKCNPTILGYDSAREILNGLGYDYIAFDDHHFKEDLQFGDAIPMFKRLQTLADENGVEFGLKLSNTFPVDVKADELPSEEMYMSGRALFPLTIEMANRISAQFNGKIRLSYSGGADYFNIDKLFSAGIWPITMATTLLKNGGYRRLNQIGDKLQKMSYKPFDGVDTEKIKALAEEARTGGYYKKALKPVSNRKIDEPLPIGECFAAACKYGCPIGQDIPEYIALCGKGRYKEALSVITDKNPLPFITGTICTHHCMDKCSRNFYESPVKIRETKLIAAKNGFDEFIKSIKKPEPKEGIKAAVVGGGPAGMSAAYFLSREGVPVTVYERENSLGGAVNIVIPEFRITAEAIERDAMLLQAWGADIQLGTQAPSLQELFDDGFTHVLYAVGAWKRGTIGIEGNEINALDFLRDVKEGAKINIGENVVVVGGGNTAMDCARAAVRLKGVNSVTILYRRTKKYMPASEDELIEALDEGVKLTELAVPIKQENGKLICRKTVLGGIDESGRRSADETDEIFEIPADTVIAAVGEKVGRGIFDANGIDMEGKARPDFKTNIENVYTAGDCRMGPSSVVECIADGRRFAEAVLGSLKHNEIPSDALESFHDYKAKKGILCENAKQESKRCLGCNVICENCVDVCPNRANLEIKCSEKTWIIHIEALCNECGNCASFCPYSGAPYLDKLTYFADENQFNASTNKGFMPLGNGKWRVRLDNTADYDLTESNSLDKDIEQLILTIEKDYGYIL